MNNDRIKIDNITSREETVRLTKPTEVVYCKYNKIENTNRASIYNTTLNELYTSERSDTTIGDYLVGPKTEIGTAYLHGFVEVFDGKFNTVNIGPRGDVQWSANCTADEIVVSGTLVLNSGDAAECIKHVVLNPGGKLICMISEVEKKLNISTSDGSAPRVFNSWICG